MKILKSLSQGLGKFFTRKKVEEENCDDEADEFVGHLSFFVTEDGTTLVDCAYKDDPLSQDMFVEMFHSVNSGFLISDTLHIIYEECLKTGQIPVYLNIIQKLSTLQLQQFQEMAIEDNLECTDSDNDPVVKPTDVINPDAQNVGE